MTLEVVPFRGHQVPILSGEISRYNLQQYLYDVQQQLRYGAGQYALGTYGISTTWGQRPAEPVGNNFDGYVQGLLYRDGPVASAEAYRLRVFGQAPLLFQEYRDGRPGKYSYDSSLDLLRTPWVGGSTGDLMKRALLYGDFGGNGWVVRIDDELVVLRPDYVTIVLEDRIYSGRKVGFRQVGIAYSEYGLAGDDAAVFLRGEYAHFVPYMPDPLASYRGMSWLTPIIREVQSDIGATDHGVAWWQNAATPNLAVSLPKEITPGQFEQFVDKMDAQHRGAMNSGRTLYTAGGADVTVIGANMQQIDYTRVVGKIETRIANASGVPATLLGFSEGMQGSSLNAGNYQAAKRNFVDTTMRDLWANFCTSIGVLFPPPDESRLWYFAPDIPFLNEDAKDLAAIQQTRTSAINTLITAGFTPDSAVAAIEADDLSLLKHTGLTSVQLLPPGSQDSDGDGRPDSEAAAADEYEAELAASRADLLRARYGEGAGERIGAGHKGGGRFRKLSDRITDAIKGFLDGDGDGDPLEDFNREQLRKAAKDLDIPLRRGASSDEIKLALLKKARGDKGKGSPPSAVGSARDADAGSRPSGLPSKPETADFDALVERLSGVRGADRAERQQKISDMIADLNAGELAKLASRYSGGGEVQLKLPKGLSIDDRRDWFAKNLAYRQDSGAGHRRPSPERKKLEREFAELQDAEEVAGDPEQSARDRQSAIDSARKLSTAAGELDEILHNGASDRAVLSRLRAAAERDADRDIVVENRVRAAYVAVLARNGRKARPGDTQLVALADLREELGESTNRHEIDAAILRLHAKDRGTSVVPENKQAALTQADRDAAISIGNQDRHNIAIDDPSPRPTGGLDLGPVISAIESGDRDKARAEMAKLLDLEGITPYGKAGDRAKFDPKQHEAIGKVRQGADVQIVRPGLTLQRPGEDIRLSKSVVEAAEEPPAGDFESRARRARKGQAAVAAVAYKFSGADTANADLFPDRAERVAISDAFRGYKGIGSSRINKSLRGGDTHVDGRVTLMDKAFAKSPLASDVLVWRGARGLEFGDRDSWPDDLTGAEWEDKAFVSTSPYRVKSEPFANDGVLMRMVAPAGTPAVHLRAPNRIETPESEILLGRGLRFRVTGDSGPGTTPRQVDVEVLPGEDIRLSKSVVEEVDAPTQRMFIQPTPENPIGSYTAPPTDMRPSARNGEALEWRGGLRKVRGTVAGESITSTGERFLVLRLDDGTFVALDERVLHPDSRPPKSVVEEIGEPDAPDAASDVEATRDELDLKKVPELKAMLKARGLPVSGRKRDLVDRLVEHQKNGAPEAPASTTPPMTPAMTPAESRLRNRLSAIADEAAPIADEVARDLESNTVKGHNEAIDFYRRQARLTELGREGSAAAHELLDLLVERDGAPWGGDPDADASRWRDVALGFGSFNRRNDLDNAEWQKLRDRYVITDRNTIIQNASLRSGQPTAAAENWARRMSKLVHSSELAHDTRLYRGAALTPDQVAALRPGAVMHDRGFNSTATTEDGFMGAAHYADTRLERLPGTIRTLFEIRAPAGTPAVDVGANEVVLDRNNRYRIVSSRLDGDTVRAVLELAP